MASARSYLPWLAGFALLAAVLWYAQDDEGAEAAPGGPKLVVLLVFDQMRADYLTRWEPLYGAGGLRRLCREGAWFQNCHYPYAGTLTGPGHAALSTGCAPDVHGLPANEWYDRASAKEVNCVVATDRYSQVPPAKVEAGKAAPKTSSPENLKAEAFADALKEGTRGAGRVVALSLKDRSSILPGGRRPDACYWVDKLGRAVTSTYYRDASHPWAAAFNAEKVSNRWRDREWGRLRDDLDYEKWSGPDEVKGEVVKDLGNTFPHKLDGGPKKTDALYHTSLAASPFGNDALLNLASRALEAEKLGQGPAVDFLSISFSSNDLIGHAWGPDSQEVLDATLRTDLQVRQLLEMLDRRVGKGRYVVVLSADHGVCPLPEVARKRGEDAGRFSASELRERAEEYLDGKFPSPGGAGEKPRKAGQAGWVLSLLSGNVYLDQQKIKRRGFAPEAVARALAGWLPGQPGIQAAFTAADLKRPASPDDDLGQKVRRSYAAGRSGDVVVVTKPYWLVSGYADGTTHGSPHEYDTHVPLLVYGAGVRPGVRKDAVTPLHAAVILARAAGVRAPKDSGLEVPARLFR